MRNLDLSNLDNLKEQLHKKLYLKKLGCGFTNIYDDICGITPPRGNDKRFRYSFYYCTNCKIKIKKIQNILDIIKLTERSINLVISDDKN